MRRLRLFGVFKEMGQESYLSNAQELEMDSESEYVATNDALSEAAGEFLRIGRRTVEVFFRDPAIDVVVTNNLMMGMMALMRAALLYEEINDLDNALFVWDMLKALPIQTDFQLKANLNSQQCKYKLEMKAQTVAVSGKIFVPRPPARPQSGSVNKNIRFTAKLP